MVLCDETTLFVPRSIAVSAYACLTLMEYIFASLFGLFFSMLLCIAQKESPFIRPKAQISAKTPEPTTDRLDQECA